jgi:hypothetical protein
MPFMKRFLIILGAIVSVAVLGLGWGYLRHVRNFPGRCDTLTLDGDINSQSFIDSRDCLVRSEAAKKTFVVKESGGNDGKAALALGILIHRHQWDVEVVGVCASACANFIFPAGKTKYLHQNALLLFHGGPYQENMMQMAEEFDQRSKTGGTPVEAVTLGQKNKEGTLIFTPGISIEDQEVQEFLSITNYSSAVDFVSKMRTASDQFYQELGVNPVISTYGQIGSYEPTYQSYKYGGFTYRLDSLRRLGIANIELADGEWRPEGNPAYQDVYEVTYP